MTEFRRVTPSFAVAPQLAPADMAAAAAAGFGTIVNNRPDREAAGQPSGAEMRAAAEAAGLAYHSLPISGPPPPALIETTARLLETAERPVLAYCKSGTRSILAWAMAQTASGALRPDEALAMAAKAGYDLSGVRGVWKK
ncbi:MAG TPA: TIGR01244 family phosphatase [Hyphomonadaceae bacterium]|nr:TIGR01244 family phosphatase [Hyphomonadaceae bacterium]